VTTRMIHPDREQVRWTGLAAMVGGALGLAFAPLYSLAYFASSDGAADANSPWVRAWADPARNLLDPLLSFASPDVVRETYFKLFLFIVVGVLVGVVGLHARQAQGGGWLEQWGFRVSFVGLLLLSIGALIGYWPTLFDFIFVAFIVPGLLLLVVGSAVRPGDLAGRRSAAPRRRPADRGRPSRALDQRGRHPRRRPSVDLSRLGDPGLLTVVNAGAGSQCCIHGLPEPTGTTASLTLGTDVALDRLNRRGRGRNPRRPAPAAPLIEPLQSPVGLSEDPRRAQRRGRMDAW
jgi:hypothetical protein